MYPNNVTRKKFNLTEEFCKQLCDKHDKGDQYPKDSRYSYTTEYNPQKDIPRGPIACFQETVRNFYGEGVSYVHVSIVLK